MIRLSHFRARRQSLLYGQHGFAMPALISVMIAASIISVAVLSVIMNNFFVVGNNVKSQQAFNIAEAGINYYLWHLSHNSTDYRDGKTTPVTPDPALGYGPYEHSYLDDNGKVTGTYTLWIKPQGNGSTIVDVRAIGKVKGTTITRTVEAQIGATSFANYAVSSDSALWFGATETADGPVHSNQGVRMDGANTSTVSSANATYVPPFALGGDGSSHPGVWCHASITSPQNCATRDKSNWQYPVPQIDYNQVSGSLCEMKKKAFAGDPATASLATGASPCSQTPTTRTAAYIPQRSSSANDSRGYLIELNNNNTYNLYSVNNVNDTQPGYQNALNDASVASNIAIPSTGVIFSEDNVWVRSNPTFNGRVTIAAGRLATNVTANIAIADNLAYQTKNGSNAIGLVAEGSVVIAPFAPPSTSGAFTLEVNAAVIAQSGSVEYPSNSSFNPQRCSRGWVNSNQKLNFYGSIASRQEWTWSWQRNSSCADAVFDAASGYYISGFKYNTTSYDYNLLYAPPPSFPITGGYQILSWREVLTRP